MPVRLLGLDDWENFRALRLEALTLEPAAYASTFEDWAKLPKSEWQNRLTQTPVFGAFVETIPVGMMGLMRQNPSKMRHRATLIMVYVQKQHRGTKVASNLLAFARDFAQSQGIRQLELNVSAENPAAIRFYQREGFVSIGQIPRAMEHNGREIDEILMARNIP